MFIKQTIKFEFRGLVPLGRLCIPATGYFYDKKKSLRKIFERIIIYRLNIAVGNVLCFPLPGPNYLLNLTPKCRMLKCFGLNL